MLPIYGREIGADAVQIGLFFSAFSLMTVLLRPLVGAGLDRFGRRPFLLTGLIGYAITMFAFANMAAVWGVVLARLFQGVASSFLWLSAQAITADAAEDRALGTAFGGVDQASNQGAILGTFIGFSFLFSLDLARGWQMLFTLYGAVSLAAVWLAFRRLPETKPAATAERGTSPIRWTRPWVLLLLVTAVTGAAWAMVSPILMIFLQDRLNAHVFDLALAYTPAAVIWAVLPGRLGLLADRLGRKPLMVWGMAAAAISSFAIPHLGSLLGLAGLWGIQALSYAAGDPAEQALVADLTGGDQRGRAYGLYALAAGLGATIGPLVGGWLYEAVGPQAPFYANGVVLAISAAALALLLRVPNPAGTTESGQHR